MYRSQFGLNFMDRLSRLPRSLLHIFSVASILTGFVGMIFILYYIVKYTFKFVLAPSINQPVLSPVLPGVNIPGVGAISFFHWIIAIFIVATIHEFSHGFIARFFKVKVKSSGFIFLGPILGAFVEPDEQQLSKKSKYAQISIFSAGPFSNILTGMIFFVILLLITPPILGMFEYNGIEVVSVDPDYPAAKVGIKPGEKILSVDNKKINTLEEFGVILNYTKPNQDIILETNIKKYTITLAKHPDNENKGFLGIRSQPFSSEIKKEVKYKYGAFIPNALLWIYQLFKWLFLVSLGIALFNLLPFWFFDGGRMFLTLLVFAFKNERKAKFVWGVVNLFLSALILINLWPFIKKILLFILTPILGI
ncbi:site-2 protease family protein [Candidatus Woesearchaeota archaeon]|nr:site-2 protease family protein [Candidatus Woesearchaeota archaeon]